MIVLCWGFMRILSECEVGRKWRVDSHDAYWMRPSGSERVRCSLLACRSRAILDPGISHAADV